MKLLSVITIILLLSVSCTTYNEVLSDNILEKVIKEVPVVEEKPEESSKTEETVKEVRTLDEEEVAEQKEIGQVTKQQVLDAVNAYDLETLTALLDGVDDVKTIVGKEVLLLHLAEEAMGIGGEKNLISELLIGKKAYLLQKDEKGRSFERVLIDLEMAATPRHEYVIEVMGDKYKRLSEALRSDSLNDIKTMLDYLPVDSNLLFRAAHEKASNIVSYVLANGVKIDSVELKTGDTALHKACNNNPYNKPFDDRYELIQTLLSNGADINLENKKGDTPFTQLFMSIQKDPSSKMGNPEKIISLLIKNGADINVAVSGNTYPLGIAGGRKLDSIVKLLVDNGAIIDEQSTAGLNNSVATMKLFVDNGADPINFVPRIQSVSDSVEKFDFVKFLLSNGLDVDDIKLVFVINNLEIIEFLLEKGADINKSALFSSWASANKSLDQIKYLVDKGADPSIANRFGKTALHYSVRKGNMEVSAYLLELDVEINAVDTYSKTPLDYYEYNNPELFDFLVSKGAKKSSEL
ncbi:MAG: ankyrin repeat domain-containing protein [Spirochaetales bacterium]|nr:ankyrin repeat domain-containing protein [Spirochaetales bacterium]